MTLIAVPDAGAQSYCSVAIADTYHSDRGNTAWSALTTAQKEQALRRATDYMDKYAAQWSGTRVSYDQQLDWPRWGVFANGFVVDHTTAPCAVQNACAWLALKASTDDLSPELDTPVTSESVGSISVTYAAGASQIKRYPAVEAMLAPYLAGGGSTVRLTRV